MPILHSNLETDLRLAVTLDERLHTTLTDMASIQRTGAVLYAGSVNGTGSDTHRLRFASLGGADHMSATAAENTDESETALTDTSVDIAVVRYSLVRNISDLAVGTGFAQDINPEVLAADMVSSYQGAFNDAFATSLATATTNVGQSGVDMDNDNFHDAIYTLQLASNPNAKVLAALHPRQFSDWQESLRGEGGIAGFSPATAAMLAIAGQGLAGSYLGVDIFIMSDVSAAGGNREGGMFTPGAFYWKNMLPQVKSAAGSALVVRQDELIVEITRDASAATNEVVGSAYFGIGVGEQARLVGIVTDQ